MKLRAAGGSTHRQVVACRAASCAEPGAAMGCWLCWGHGSSQPAAAHGSERSSFRLTSSETPQWRLRQLHRRPGGFSARLPSLELQTRQGVLSRGRHHLSWQRRLPLLSPPLARWSACVPSPPSPSLPAAASGRPWVFGLAVVELLVGVWLDQRVAVPFAVAAQS